MRRSSTVPRASIKIHGGHSGLASGARRSQQAPLFGWLINLDGVRVDIRGGVYSIARDGWHVFSEKVAYHVSGGQAGATETAFHPDSSRMVDQGSGTGHKVPFSTALVSPCTADSVGPAAPGVVQWRNTIRSSSVLYSGQAPNGASQGGSCNFVWDQMILVKHCRDGAGGSNVRISRAGSGFGHKAAGRCLECQVQAYSSLWVKSISVTAGSVGPAAPGVAQ